MGILNLTPDSFYDVNSSLNKTKLKDRLNSIIKSDIIDVGAESSRPGAVPVSENEEIERLNYFLDIGFKHKCLSIDSYKTPVIKYCLDNGFNMINDISGGGENFANIDLAKEYNVPICLMHMKGTPMNMQHNPQYDDLIDELISYFNERIEYCNKIDYNLNKLIIDPGIGFGKSKEDNYKIISNIRKFKKIGCKVLIGISRKSFLQLRNNKPKDRLSASIAMQSISVYHGADIIRTHDVDELIDCIDVISNLKK